MIERYQIPKKPYCPFCGKKADVKKDKKPNPGSDGLYCFGCKGCNVRFWL